MECLKCGTCCTYMEFRTTETVSEDMKRWYGYHGVMVQEDGDLTWIIVPIPCSQLDRETMKCSIYEDRPEHCRKTNCRTMDYGKYL